MLGMLLFLLLTGTFLALGAGMLLAGLYLSSGRGRTIGVRVAGGTIAVLGTTQVLFVVYVIYPYLFGLD